MPSLDYLVFQEQRSLVLASLEVLFALTFTCGTARTTAKSNFYDVKEQPLTWFSSGSLSQIGKGFACCKGKPTSSAAL